MKKKDFLIWLQSYIFTHIFGRVPDADDQLKTKPLAKAIWCYSVSSSGALNPNPVAMDEFGNAIVTVESDDTVTTVTIPAEGCKWIDKHLCPWPLWNDADRRKEGKQYRKISRYTLDEQNMEIVPMVLVDKYNEETNAFESILGSETYVCLITDICSGQSQISRYQAMISDGYIYRS